MEKENLKVLLYKMWVDYCLLNPSAKKIYDLLIAEGELVINDHIALRTFNHPKLNIDKLAYHFEKYGYKIMDEYRFTGKKLYARHWQHEDPEIPKIFISQLEIEKLSPSSQEIILNLIEQMDDEIVKDENFLFQGTPWKITFKEYQMLNAESEYAAWLSAIGFRPNHFTVSINHLKKYNNIFDLNKFITKNGYELNTSGGEVKGSEIDMLEQSSTMAKEVSINFIDGENKIPGCYYEFAKRYKQANGEIYHGFIEKSADKIFESTNKIIK